MLRHHELLGNELHNARISIEPPTRSPAYPGETVFDGSVLWIATGITADSWTASHRNPAPPQIPPFFSWSIDLDEIDLGFGTVISLYFSTIPPGSSQWSTFERLAQYTLGTNLPAFGGILNLNSWIEQRGIGRYMPLVSLFGSARPSNLEITAIAPANAATIATIGRFTEPGTSRIYFDAKAIEISKCQAGFAGKLFA